MKRVFVLTILFYIGHFPLMNAQSLNDGMYNNQWENERDAINQEVIEKQRWQNDYYYEYLRNQQYNSQLYQKVNTAVNQAKGGIRIETSSYPPTSSSSKHTTNQQAQQMKKAQYEANHRAWQEQRRAQQAQAAEEARIRKKREEQRKREDKQRRYVQARDMDLQISAGHYQRQHNQITYNVTEGYERTMNYQPEGSQQLQSQYIPSSDKPTYDIAAIISKSGGGTPVSLAQPISSLRIQYTDYELEREKELIRSIRSMEPQNPLFTPSVEEETFTHSTEEEKLKWNEFQEDLVPSHSAALNYFLTNDKAIPQLYSINNKGEFVFEANNKNKAFVISPDGLSLTIYTFEEHFWDDDNIINKIKNEDFKEFYNESFEFDYPTLNSIKSEKIKFEDLKDMSPDKLKKLLPQIKAKMKMTIVDNSSTLSYQRYSFCPQTIRGSLAALLTDSYINETEVKSIKGQLSGGGKAEANINASLGLIENPSYGAAVKFSALEAGTSASQGSVVAIGNQSYLFNVKGDAKIGAGVSYKEKKTLGQQTSKGEWGYEMEKPIFPGIYAGGGVNVEVKNITMKAKQSENEDTSKD